MFSRGKNVVVCARTYPSQEQVLDFAIKWDAYVVISYRKIFNASHLDNTLKYRNNYLSDLPRRLRDLLRRTPNLEDGFKDQWANTPAYPANTAKVFRL